jgi:hypothetical protein
MHTHHAKNWTAPPGTAEIPLSKQLNKIAAICSLIALSGILLGCSTPVGSTRFPSAGANFTPSPTFDLSPDVLWDSTLATLDAERIPIASLDKASGRIITDYVPGTAHMYAGGLGGSQNSRYKYNLTISSNSPGSRLSIMCRVESAYSGSHTVPFRDVSGEVPDLVKGLETWLYEKFQSKAESRAQTANR